METMDKALRSANTSEVAGLAMTLQGFAKELLEGGVIT
jgi:hypothetical protein